MTRAEGDQVLPGVGCAATPSAGDGSEHNWKGEAAALAVGILQIADRYEQAVEHMGGDSELLRSSVRTWAKYVNETVTSKFDDCPCEVCEVATELAKERALVGKYQQAMWDIYGILGFDQDGDKTPAATLAGARLVGERSPDDALIDLLIRSAKEFRKDYDEAIKDEPRVHWVAATAVEHSPLRPPTWDGEWWRAWCQDLMCGWKIEGDHDGVIAAAEAHSFGDRVGVPDQGAGGGDLGGSVLSTPQEHPHQTEQVGVDAEVRRLNRLVIFWKAIAEAREASYFAVVQAVRDATQSDESTAR